MVTKNKVSTSTIATCRITRSTLKNKEMQAKENALANVKKTKVSRAKQQKSTVLPAIKRNALVDIPDNIPRNDMAPAEPEPKKKRKRTKAKKDNISLSSESSDGEDIPVSKILKSRVGVPMKAPDGFGLPPEVAARASRFARTKQVAASKTASVQPLQKQLVQGKLNLVEVLLPARKFTKAKASIVPTKAFLEAPTSGPQSHNQPLTLSETRNSKSSGHIPASSNSPDQSRTLEETSSVLPNPGPRIDFRSLYKQKNLNNFLKAQKHSTSGKQTQAKLLGASILSKQSSSFQTKSIGKVQLVLPILRLKATSEKSTHNEEDIEDSGEPTLDEKETIQNDPEPGSEYTAGLKNKEKKKAFTSESDPIEDDLELELLGSAYTTGKKGKENCNVSNPQPENEEVQTIIEQDSAGRYNAEQKAYTPYSDWEDQIVQNNMELDSGNGCREAPSPIPESDQDDPGVQANMELKLGGTHNVGQKGEGNGKASQRVERYACNNRMEDEDEVEVEASSWETDDEEYYHEQMEEFERGLIELKEKEKRESKKIDTLECQIGSLADDLRREVNRELFEQQQLYIANWHELKQTKETIAHEIEFLKELQAKCTRKREKQLCSVKKKEESQKGKSAQVLAQVIMESNFDMTQEQRSQERDKIAGPSSSASRANSAKGQGREEQKHAGSKAPSIISRSHRSRGGEAQEQEAQEPEAPDSASKAIARDEPLNKEPSQAQFPTDLLKDFRRRSRRPAPPPLSSIVSKNPSATMALSNSSGRNVKKQAKAKSTSNNTISSQATSRDADDEDEEDVQAFGPRRKRNIERNTGAYQRPEDQNLSYYKPKTKGALKKAKTLLRGHIAIDDAFPEAREEGESLASEYLEYALGEARQTYGNISDEEHGHTISMDQLVWGERSTYRQSLKNIVKDGIKDLYPEIFHLCGTSTPPANQLSRKKQTLQNILKYEKIFCHSTEKHRDGSKANFCHPAIKALVIRCFYNCSNPIARKYADAFSEIVPIPAIALVITLVRAILDGYKDGDGEYTNKDFSATCYHSFYDKIIMHIKKYREDPSRDHAGRKNFDKFWKKCANKGMQYIRAPPPQAPSDPSHDIAIFTESDAEMDYASV